jgi:hypothetical protein
MGNSDPHSRSGIPFELKLMDFYRILDFKRAGFSSGPLFLGNYHCNFIKFDNGLLICAHPFIFYKHDEDVA